MFPTKPEEMTSIETGPVPATLRKAASEKEPERWARGMCVHSFTNFTELGLLSLELRVRSLWSWVSIEYWAIFRKVRRKKGRQEKRIERGREGIKKGRREEGKSPEPAYWTQWLCHKPGKPRSIKPFNTQKENCFAFVFLIQRTDLC